MSILPRLSLLILASQCTGLNAQSQNAVRTYKKFTDVAFQPGDKILAPEISFRLSGGSPVIPEYIDSVGVIAEFIQKHPTMIIEIGVFTDCRGNAEDNEKMTAMRAESVLRVLEDKFKISKERIVLKGYGEKDPVVSEEKILAEPDKKEQEKLHLLNHWVEIKILEL